MLDVKWIEAMVREKMLEDPVPRKIQMRSHVGWYQDNDDESYALEQIDKEITHARDEARRVYKTDVSIGRVYHLQCAGGTIFYVLVFNHG